MIKLWEWMSEKILFKNHTSIPNMTLILDGLIVPKSLFKIIKKLSYCFEMNFVKIIHLLEMLLKGNVMIFVLTTRIAT
jgi:hypothetical protein